MKQSPLKRLLSAEDGWTGGHLVGLIAGLLVITKGFAKLCAGATEAFAEATSRGDFVKADRLIAVASFFAPLRRRPPEPRRGKSREE